MHILIVLLALLFLPSEIFANSNSTTIQMEKMDVDGLVDEELNAIERDLETIRFYNRNGTKKVDKLNKYQQNFQELIPKQIELTKGRRKIQQLIDAKTKYISCISKKDEEDCRDLKEDLEKINKDVPPISSNNTYILNREVLAQMRKCSEVTREDFPEFKAVIRIDLYLDPSGYVSRSILNPLKSVSNIDLNMFNKCIVHFSKQLQYFNPFKAAAFVEQDFIFGIY